MEGGNWRQQGTEICPPVPLAPEQPHPPASSAPVSSEGAAVGSAASSAMGSALAGFLSSPNVMHITAPARPDGSLSTGVIHVMVLMPGGADVTPQRTDENVAGVGTTWTYDSQKDSQHEMCGICYEPFQDGSEVTSLPCAGQGCSSVWHATCIRKWFRNSHEISCPLCRTSIETDFEPTPSPQASAAVMLMPDLLHELLMMAVMGGAGPSSLEDAPRLLPPHLGFQSTHIQLAQRGQGPRPDAPPQFHVSSNASPRFPPQGFVGRPRHSPGFSRPPSSFSEAYGPPARITPPSMNVQPFVGGSHPSTTFRPMPIYRSLHGGYPSGRAPSRAWDGDNYHSAPYSGHHGHHRHSSGQSWSGRSWSMQSPPSTYRPVAAPRALGYRDRESGESHVEEEAMWGPVPHRM